MKKSFKTFLSKLSRKKSKRSLIYNYNLDNIVITEEPSTSSITRVTTNSLSRKFHSFSCTGDRSVNLYRKSSLNELETIYFGLSRNETLDAGSRKELSTQSHNLSMLEIQTPRNFSIESSDIDKNRILYEDLFNFIQNFSIYDSQFLYHIRKSICSESIGILSEMNGFRKDLLIFSSLFYYFSNHSICNIEQLLSQFWEINDKRLQDGKFLRMIESNSRELNELEENISEILKVRTKRNLICAECGENSVSVLYLPCGHIIMCSECHGKLKFNKCKQCSCTIDEFHNVYF